MSIWCRFHGVPAEERLHWRSFLVKLGTENLKGAKNEELFVASHKYADLSHLHIKIFFVLTITNGTSTFQFVWRINILTVCKITETKVQSRKLLSNWSVKSFDLSCFHIKFNVFSFSGQFILCIPYLEMYAYMLLAKMNMMNLLVSMKCFLHLSYEHLFTFLPV
jgi:hypothetical protein